MAKLFIYLPTYNRPQSLEAQLRALLPQVREHPDEVRLLVRDNASNKFLLTEIAAGITNTVNCEILQNAGNIGANANIALGFVFARPNEFLWILSDNDIVLPNAVSYILSNLDDEIDFFCFTEHSELVDDVYHNWDDGWQIPMDWRMGLISDALYNMKSVREDVQEAFYFHNSSFPHLAVACAAAKRKGISKFRLLPRRKISAREASSLEQPTDYSLAHVCMPLLVPLFPAWEAKSFCRKWLKAHGVQFHLNKKRHPHLYIQSVATLKHYGGWSANFLILLSALIAIIARPYLERRPVIVKALKDRLSDSGLERAKRVRSYFCGK